MKALTYAELRQLQACVFTDDTKTAPSLGYSYRGAGVVIKLSNRHMWGFQFPFPIARGDFKVASVDDDLLQQSVIAIDLACIQTCSTPPSSAAASVIC